MSESTSVPARVYLDWAAATPLSPAAQAAMVPYFATHFGNPSAVHAEGQKARQAVEAARRQVARSLSVQASQITFTGGGTEANNIALLGLLQALRASGRPYEEMTILTTALEHPSISEPLAYAVRTWGVTVKTMPVRETGEIDLSALPGLLTPEVVLIATAYVNSEIGVIQPVRQLRRLLRARGAAAGSPPYLLLDAAQAPLWLPCEPERVGVDLLTVDFAKCCGPKGSGLVVNRTKWQLQPVVHGGGQEQGVRPGTEAVPLIVGGATALAEAQAQWEERQSAVRAVRDAGIDLLLRDVPGAVLNGPTGDQRVANNINLSIPGIDTEYATVVLDQAGFAVSTKSACSGAGSGESPVVRAISHDTARAAATLRCTLGPDTTVAALERFAHTLAAHVTRQRRFDSNSE
ncbi:MAG: cysteine desulfurase family protein [Patescibacteria group bacterium]